MKLRLLLMLAACIASSQAANLSVVLTNSSLTGAPGDLLQYFATVTNVSLTDTIYLNGSSSTSASGFLTDLTMPFDINAPLFMNPGDVSGPFEIFDVMIDPATPNGPYTGSIMSISGGLDSMTFDDLADIGFVVQVNTPAPSAAPEPGTGALLLAAAAAAFVILTRNPHGRPRA